jgi:hypothetical protein
VGFVVDKVALGQVFRCQFNSTGAPLLGKGQNIIIIFITGLHSKPQGRGASVASAAGPFTTLKIKGDNEFEKIKNKYGKLVPMLTTRDTIMLEQ